MILTKLFILSVVLLYLFSDDLIKTENSNTKDIILSTIGTLCPTADICHLKNKRTLGTDSWPKDSVPCCRECSCQNNCDFDGNCCFKDLDVNVSQNNDGISVFNTTKNNKYHSTCLFPGTTTRNTSLRYYSMIDVCPSAESESQADSSTVDENILHCGDVEVAWRSTLLPVYSPSTRKLYKNTICSKCHGIKDGIVWEIIRKCWSFRNYTRHVHIDISEFVNIHPERSDTNECQLFYNYPGDWKEIEHTRCTQQPLVRSCARVNFEIPEYINITANEIVSACESSFRSPIATSKASIPLHEHQVFSNPFCSICNLHWFKNEENLQKFSMCKNPNIDDRHFIGSSSYVYIISGSELQTKYVDIGTTDIYVPVACPEDLDETQVVKSCRPIYCRTGQIRNRAGKCHYITLRWQATYEIVVDLIPEQDIPIYFLKEREISSDASWVTPPLPNLWDIINVYYQPAYIGGKVTIGRIKVSVRPKNILPLKSVIGAVKTLMKEHWTVYLNGKLFKLQPNFSPVYDFSYIGDESRCAEILAFNINRTKDTTFCPFVKIILRDIRVISKPAFVLTKLVFCEQVDLWPSEYDHIVTGKIIFYKRMQRTFFEGEFANVHDHETGNATVRMCLDDADFRIVQVSSAVEVDVTSPKYVNALSIILTVCLDLFSFL